MTAHVLSNIQIQHSPKAVPLVLYTTTVISVDNGLLRTSTGCTILAPSLTLYVDWLNVTVISNNTVIFATLNS